MEAAQHVADPEQGAVPLWTGMYELAVDEGHCFAALYVSTGPGDMRGALKSVGLQMLDKADDGPRPASGSEDCSVLHEAVWAGLHR